MPFLSGGEEALAPQQWVKIICKRGGGFVDIPKENTLADMLTTITTILNAS